MKNKSIKIYLIIVAMLVVLGLGTYYVLQNPLPESTDELLDSIPKNVTISGTYVCLPMVDESSVGTDECVFGLKADSGEYYMVNFGQSASAMEQFRKMEHITAEGFVVIKEALSTDQWVKYNMKGIFTITNLHAPRRN